MTNAQHTPDLSAAIDTLGESIHETIAERDRLKALNTELVGALKEANFTLTRFYQTREGDMPAVVNLVRSAISKAEGK